MVVGVKLLNNKTHRGRSMITCKTPVRLCFWAVKEPFQLSLAATPLSGPLPNMTLGSRVETNSKQGSSVAQPPREAIATNT